MDLPELSDTASKTAQKAKTLVAWLPDPFQCPECSTFCDATKAYDPQRAAFYPGGQAPAWKCPNCGAEYVRTTE